MVSNLAAHKRTFAPRVRRLDEDTALANLTAKTVWCRRPIIPFASTEWAWVWPESHHTIRVVELLRAVCNRCFGYPVSRGLFGVESLGSAP
jgi:hypothetical protein